MGEIITQEIPYTGKGALLHKKVLYTGMDKNTVETVLWTNPSPSSNFSGQDVTLSDGISNYNYIAIEYAYATSYNTGDFISTAMMSVSDFKKGTFNTATRRNNIALDITNVSEATYSRPAMYVNETTIRIRNCYAGSASGTSDANCIPLKIIGIKQHGTIKPQTADLSSPPNVVYTNASMANNATATLAVTQTPKYIVICMNNQASSYNFGTLIINVEDNTAYMIGYWSQIFQNQSYPDWTDFITSISDSSIGIKNAWGSTVRMDLCVYY